LSAAILPPLVLAALVIWKPRHAWRWFTGNPLDGPPGRPRHRTNATWNRPATALLHPVPVIRWHWWRRRRRAAIRSGGTLGAVMLAWALIVSLLWTAVVLLLGALAGAWLAAPWITVRARGWQHHRTYIRPLSAAIRAELGAPPERLAITADRSEVVIGLPLEFTGSPRDREAITRAVTAKLAIEAPDAAWAPEGRKPQVTFTKSQPPPAKVTFGDIGAAVEAAAEHEIVMGIARRGVPVTLSVDNDSPHLGLSMGSGDGKSTVAKNMAAQLLFHGALVMVLDIKLISHMWARGLPNVSYAGTPAEIESAMVWLAAEVSRRNKVALAGADVEGVVHARVGPRIFIIAEELNATQNRLKAWWNREMEMKGRSPGSEALDEVMFLGRQVHINVLQIGQRLSVKATGSGDARENLGVLVFSDPTAAAWKMLCPQHVMPPASGHLGRLQVVTRKAVRETQGAYMTGRQARDFAVAGTVAVPRPDMPCVAIPAGVPDMPALDAAAGPDHGFVTANPPLVPLGPAGAVTLKEAFAAGLFPTLEAAQRAAHRPGFPAVVGQRGRAHLYDVGDLAALRSEKVRAGG
jgi:hypothetical protein